jgi:hypothetical protein
MSTTVHVEGVTYTRIEALAKLELSSKTTLVKYCKTLGIPRGLHFFTEEEFKQMQSLRQWRERGGRFDDFCLTDKIKTSFA